MTIKDYADTQIITFSNKVNEFNLNTPYISQNVHDILLNLIFAHNVKKYILIDCVDCIEIVFKHDDDIIFNYVFDYVNDDKISVTTIDIYDNFENYCNACFDFDENENEKYKKIFDLLLN